MSRTQLKALDNPVDTAKNKSNEALVALLQDNRTLRIGMLNNPLSGGNRKRLLQIRKVAANYPQVIQREVQTPAEVALTLSDFARQEIRILVVNGGDGTVQAVLTAIFNDQAFEKMPLIAVLRSAGTTSMIAGDIGLKGSRQKALQRLFRWTHTKDSQATVLQRPVLRIQVPLEKRPVYGMFFGAAGIYQATHFYHQKIHTKGLRGEVGPGITLARFILAAAFKDSKALSSVPVTTRLNHNLPEQHHFFAVFVTSLERLFLGLRPYWGTEPGPLHYTAIGSRPHRFVRLLPSLMRGRQNPQIKPANGYISHNVDEIQLTLNSGFSLDGQLYHADSQQGPVVVAYGGHASFLQL